MNDETPSPNPIFRLIRPLSLQLRDWCGVVSYRAEMKKGYPVTEAELDRIASYFVKAMLLQAQKDGADVSAFAHRFENYKEVTVENPPAGETASSQQG